MTDPTHDTRTSPASIDRPGKLSAGLAWSVLFTSLAWTGLVMALAINAWHAEVLRKYIAGKTLVSLGAIMVLAGVIGAALAIREMGWPQTRAGRWIAAWLWTVAICVGVGSSHSLASVGHWPWIEILAGTALAIVGYCAVTILRHRLGKTQAILPSPEVR